MVAMLNAERMADDIKAARQPMVGHNAPGFMLTLARAVEMEQ